MAAVTSHLRTHEPCHYMAGGDASTIDRHRRRRVISQGNHPREAEGSRLKGRRVIGPIQYNKPRGYVISPVASPAIILATRTARYSWAPMSTSAIQSVEREYRPYFSYFLSSRSPYFRFPALDLSLNRALCNLLSSTSNSAVFLLL
jgi:hypothetical protein